MNLELLGVVLRMSTPILLAGTGALYNDKSGVTNITLEGSMLISSFVAVAFSYFARTWWIGMLAGILVGVFVSLLFHVITSVLGGDELVVGFAFNIFLDGMSIFLLKQIFHKSGSLVSERIQEIPVVKAKWLENIPILGDIFAGHTWIVYFAFLFSLATYIIFFHTPIGLKIIACGENPQAAASVGIDVKHVYLGCNLINGLLCGLAGVQLSLGFLSLFTQGMTVGKGFIALGSVIFSRGNPLRLMAITLFFGLADAISNQMQLYNFPSELILMLPYLAVVILTFIDNDQFKAKFSLNNKK